VRRLNQQIALQGEGAKHKVAEAGVHNVRRRKMPAGGSLAVTERLRVPASRVSLKNSKKKLGGLVWAVKVLNRTNFLANDVRQSVAGKSSIPNGRIGGGKVRKGPPTRT